MNFANLRIHVQLKRQKRFRRSCSAAARQLVAINPTGNKVMKFMFRKYRRKFYTSTLNRDFFYRDSFVPLLHTWREIMTYRYNFQRIGSIFPLRERLRSSQSIFEAACFRVFPRVEPRARYPVEFVIEWKHDVYAVIQIDWTSANYTMIRWHGPRARGGKTTRSADEISSVRAGNRLDASTRSASNIFNCRFALAVVLLARVVKSKRREDLTRPDGEASGDLRPSRRWDRRWNAVESSRGWWNLFRRARRW